MGWSSRTQGYLSEGALVTATVIFQRLAGRDPMAAAPWLKDYLRSDLKKAARALERIHPDLPAERGGGRSRRFRRRLISGPVPPHVRR